MGTAPLVGINDIIITILISYDKGAIGACAARRFSLPATDSIGRRGFTAAVAAPVTPAGA